LDWAGPSSVILGWANAFQLQKHKANNGEWINSLSTIHFAEQWKSSNEGEEGIRERRGNWHAVAAVEAHDGVRWWRRFQAALLQFFFFLPCAKALASIFPPHLLRFVPLFFTSYPSFSLSFWSLVSLSILSPFFFFVCLRFVRFLSSLLSLYPPLFFFLFFAISNPSPPFFFSSSFFFPPSLHLSPLVFIRRKRGR
jgi:hypothetical protein